MLHPGQQPGSGTRRHKHTTGVTQTGDVVHTCVACQHHPRTSRTNGLLTVTYPLRPRPLVPENLFRYRKIHFFLWKNSYKQESKVSSQKQNHKHFWNSLKNLFYNWHTCTACPITQSVRTCPQCVCVHWLKICFKGEYPVVECFCWWWIYK